MSVALGTLILNSNSISFQIDRENSRFVFLDFSCHQATLNSSFLFNLIIKVVRFSDRNVLIHNVFSTEPLVLKTILHLAVIEVGSIKNHDPFIFPTKENQRDLLNVLAHIVYEVSDCLSSGS